MSTKDRLPNRAASPEPAPQNPPLPLPGAAVPVAVPPVVAGAAVTEITRVAVPVPPEFVAPIVTVLLPTSVGVPEIAPVVVSTVSPAGRLVAL